MRLLVFDTETTGLPPRGAPPNPETYPHIVQMSFLFVDTETDRVKEFDYIIKVAVPIPEETTAIHGITQERSQKSGFDFVDIFNILRELLVQCDLVVGHNIEFDVNMLRAECMRHKVAFDIPMNLFCTMRRSTELCGLISARGYPKPPKLSELYTHLFKEDRPPKDLHNALTDVYVCLRCFYMVQLERDLPPGVLKCIR